MATATMTARAGYLLSLMTDRGESFWTAVYPVYIRRDMTRSDMRDLICEGLIRTNGQYRGVVGLFNMPSTDYKRFLSFLRKHELHLPFMEFRRLKAHQDREGELRWQ